MATAQAVVLKRGCSLCASCPSLLRFCHCDPCLCFPRCWGRPVPLRVGCPSPQVREAPLVAVFLVYPIIRKILGQLSFFYFLDWGPTSLWILRLGRFEVGRPLSLGPLRFSPLPPLPDPLCRSARLPVSPQVLGHPLVVALLDYLLLYEGVVLALLYLLLLKLLHVSERVDFWALSSSTSLRWRRRLSM